MIGFEFEGSGGTLETLRVPRATVEANCPVIGRLSELSTAHLESKTWTLRRTEEHYQVTCTTALILPTAMEQQLEVRNCLPHHLATPSETIFARDDNDSTPKFRSQILASSLNRALPEQPPADLRRFRSHRNMFSNYLPHSKLSVNAEPQISLTQFSSNQIPGTSSDRPAKARWTTHSILPSNRCTLCFRQGTTSLPPARQRQAYHALSVRPVTEPRQQRMFRESTGPSQHSSMSSRKRQSCARRYGETSGSRSWTFY